MSSLLERLVPVIDTRLAVVINAAVNLNVQLSELNELRERLRKANLLARISQRIDRRKRKRKKTPLHLAPHLLGSPCHHLAQTCKTIPRRELGREAGRSD
jgi:hypothetical protein